MAFAGMSVAQDIYTSGCYTPSGASHTKAALYKNGSMLYEFGPGISSFDYVAQDVSCFGGNVFWITNAIVGNDPVRGIVQKNNGTIFLDEGSDNDYGMNKLAIDHDGWVVAAGCKKSGNFWRAARWMCSADGNTSATVDWLGNTSYNSSAYGATWHDEFAYTCGMQYTSSSAFRGIIWRGTSVYLELPYNYEPRSIVVDDAGDVWTAGLYYDGSTTSTRVYRGNALIYTLSTTNSRAWDIYIDDANDIYVTGWEGNNLIVWKNGTSVYSISGGSNSWAVKANSIGVYNAGYLGGSGKIWKNGSVLYSPSNCEQLYGIFVEEPECTDNEVRSLPFYEGFETGSTNWPCWTTVDVDNNNGGNHYRPFWGRIGTNGSVSPYAGNYFVHHGWGVNAQEGWLISPRLFLQPGQDNTVLTFWSNEISSSYSDYRGVWISTSGIGTSNFTEVYSVSSPSSTWHQVSVDLSAYQGQAVYIAFKYTGTDGIGWDIDEVNVTESFQPCSDASVPYTLDFSSSNNCWTAYDADMSGGQKCWQHTTSEGDGCYYHPYGQQDTPQTGWLFSRRVTLPSGNYNYTLSFKAMNGSSGGSGETHTAWIAVDKWDAYDPADYIQIWQEPSFNGSWTTYTVDLTPYKGHTVSIAFKYVGTWAHHWYIDDFSITQETVQYTITANANNNSWGTVSGGGTYNAGATCTLTATPASGYEFLKWTKNGAEVSTNPSYSFTVTENASYTAVFGEPSVNYYTITTNVSPADAGTVEGAGVYPQGTTTYLTATPNMGWTFSHWNDGITSNPRSITVNGDATYTAHFLQQNYTITVAADPPQGGTVSGGGSYHYGATATLTATANSGYQFQAWSDGSTQNPHPVTVTGNADYKAIFSEVGTTYYNVSANVRPANAGSVDGTGAYPAGTTVTLTATANPGYTFSHWNDGITSNPRTVTVNSNLSFTANFMASTYTITVNANPSNGGTVTGDGSYHYGETATLRATPNSGFTFVGWSDGSTELTHNVTVTGNATYTATFSQGTVTYYSVNLVCNSSEGSVEGGGFYPAGSTITIQAIPNEGYFFEKWSDESTRNPRQITVNSDITLAAFFQGTGVDEEELNPMTLYPNPAKESIRILGIKVNSTIEIYNSFGERVRTVNAGPDQEIGVSDLASGLYLVRCGNRILRFIKQQ